MSKTIFMIHGMHCGGWCWENYKGYFEARGYRCITPTLRFHDICHLDKPDPLLGTTSLLDYANDLEKQIKALDEPPIIMGHSMGGLLTQILGARGFGKALVLLTPASPHGISVFKYSVLKSFLKSFLRYGFWKITLKPTFKGMVYSCLHLMDKDEQKKIFKRLAYESGRAACEIGFWFFDYRGASRVDESMIKCPMLIIGAGEDRITPVSIIKKIAEKYSEASYKEFPSHAHWVIGQPGWEDIADYINNWLKEKI